MKILNTRVSVNRLRLILKRGDTLEAFVFHKKIGSYIECRVCMVDHRGIYCKITDNGLKKLRNTLCEDYCTSISKTQHIVKWSHVYEVYLN